jgi:hypothetical protein
VANSRNWSRINDFVACVLAVINHGTLARCPGYIAARFVQPPRAATRTSCVHSNEERSCSHAAAFIPRPLARRHGPGRSKIQILARRKHRHLGRPPISTNFPHPLGLAFTTAMSSCCTTGTSCWCSISRPNLLLAEYAAAGLPMSLAPTTRITEVSANDGLRNVLVRGEVENMVQSAMERKASRRAQRTDRP